MSEVSKHKPGSIGEMIDVALPMVVSFGCDTAMIFTDRLFLAKLGSQTMSAAMTGGLSVFMLMSFFLGLIGYTTALVAQYLGAGKKESCARSLTQAVMISLAAYPVVLALIPAAHFAFSKSGIDAVELHEQLKYFNILIFGSVFSLLRHAFSAFFTGIGRTRVVMMGAAVAMTVNMILNYIFVFGKFGCPVLGIRGAALGTVIAGACGALALLAVYLSKDISREFMVASSWGFDRKIMGKLWQYGCPGGIEMVSNLLAFTAMVFVFHSEGLVAAAATTIVFNWDMVTFIPLMGIEIGVTSLVGRYMGAQQIDVVKHVVHSGVTMGVIYGALMIAVFILMPVKLVEVFHPRIADGIFSQASPLAISMVRLVAFYVMAQALFMVFIGALRGAGDTVWAMRISVGIHWILLAVMVFLLKFWHTTVYQAWLSLVIVFMFFSASSFVRYQMGQWKNIHVIEPEMS